MTRDQILAIASELVIVNDGAYRWVGRRDDVYRWLDDHGFTRRFDAAHNTGNSVTMSADDYQELCDDTDCLIDTSGSYGPAGVNPHELIDEIEAEADYLYIH